MTEGHHAKVEDKPEVKKAGGVYYTPTYIVDYIVKNTVGKLLSEEGMTPKQAAKVRVLDPACGSGIVPYCCLPDTPRLAPGLVCEGRCRETFHREELRHISGAGWRMATDNGGAEAHLLNNIYGVDIDYAGGGGDEVVACF